MKFYNLILLGLILGFTASCGSHLSDSGNTSFESRADINVNEDDEEVYDASGALQALCAPLKMNNVNFDSQLELYFKNGVNIPDQIYLRLKEVPADVVSGLKYIQFFKQYEVSGGGVMTESSPVEFVFLHKNSRTEVSMNTTINSLSKGVIEQVISHNSLNNYGYTTANFLDDFDIVLRGLDLKYESLLTALYESSGSNVAIANQAALLPSYPADPNVYEKADNSSYMINLHPMIGRKGSGLSEQMFKSEIESACLQPY